MSLIPCRAEREPGQGEVDAQGPGWVPDCASSWWPPCLVTDLWSFCFRPPDAGGSGKRCGLGKGMHVLESPLGAGCCVAGCKETQCYQALWTHAETEFAK